MRQDFRHQKGKRRDNSLKNGKVLLFGLHPCLAALQNPNRSNHDLWITKRAFEALDSDLRRKISSVCSPRFVDSDVIESRLGREEVHQGILLEVSPLENFSLEDIVHESGKNAILVLLDQVTDPHNVGAILRSAAAFGVDAVVMPHHHSTEAIATLAKCASGALEIVPLIAVGNLKQALDYLKTQDFWCVGLDEEGETEISSFAFDGRIALVLGAEGQGMRRLTKETCDHLLKLPTTPVFPTLNVSNAAAITLYEIFCQTTKRGKSS